MDYYCGKCGTPLNENGLCPKCQLLPNHTSTQTISDNNNKKRKSKTLLIVSIVLAAILLVSGVVACLFCFDVFSTSIENEITAHSLVITQDDHVYFSGCGSLIDISNDEQPMLLTTFDDNQTLGLLSDKSAYDGENIYSLISDHREIYKQTINGDGFATQEIFVNEQSLKDAFTNKLGTDVINPASIHDLSICDNYLCFFFAPSLEFAVSDSDVAYKIGKINLDTKEIDFFDDIHASALAAKDGWIYYFDNGYTYNTSNNTYTTNSNIFGIYKMRIDGSENQLLLDGFEQDSSDMNDSSLLCNDFQIYDDYLYFTDDSKEGQSRVCRIMLDGSQKEYLTKEGAYNYTVDINNNKVYYSTGLFNMADEDARTVYEVSMETGDETELFKVTGNREFTVYDDYLYISDMYQFISFTKDGVLPCGKRYNLTNGSAETLYGKKEFEIQFDPNTGSYDIIGGDNTPVYYWETVDTSTDYVL